ncbi:hypothetical protein [Pontibacter beigongshangensis]|uniref:hypothetical protein n=1 Tax=Pontibacter beigongshangensis TaxID=2574733 RepID=UPI0016502DA7|nr:hypothetical protein [Pontibacter beigongshangensis]
MVHLLDTIRVLVSEETGVQYTRRLAMPYAQMNGPFEDVSDEFDRYDFVTSFQDEFGEPYYVLEPMQKVLDGWLVYLESQSSHNIKFSAS